MVAEVLAAVAILLGQKSDWDSCKKTLLANPSYLIPTLLSYDRDNVPADFIKKLQPYVSKTEFNPDHAKKISAAVAGLCAWVLAIHAYH